MNTNWISTDLLVQLLKVKEVAGAPTEGNAAPRSLPSGRYGSFLLRTLCLGASSFAEHYVIEGVDFLPAQVAQLAPNSRSGLSFGLFDNDLEHFDRPRSLPRLCQSA
ncbi:MAG: hypothetical protein R2867_27315 [Caldilineaceae bacterium]